MFKYYIFACIGKIEAQNNLISAVLQKKLDSKLKKYELNEKQQAVKNSKLQAYADEKVEKIKIQID